MMEQYKFLVKGNSGNYHIIFTKDDNNLRVTCTCQAGEHGLYCKHRIAIIKGQTSNVLSGNEAQATEIASFLKDTNLEKALIEFEIAQTNCDLAQKRLSTAKKNLAKVMGGQTL